MAKSIRLLKIDNKNIPSYKVKLLQSLHFHTDLNRATREAYHLKRDGMRKRFEFGDLVIVITRPLFVGLHVEF
ncbi:MAG: hypothetical protein U9N52_06880 [Campylobacterota bacterium]|nr:hypothetical protein [Campylobacterota bacterium]